MENNYIEITYFATGETLHPKQFDNKDDMVYINKNNISFITPVKERKGEFITETYGNYFVIGMNSGEKFILRGKEWESFEGSF